MLLLGAFGLSLSSSSSSSSSAVPAGLQFAPQFSDHAVLQREPAAAAVYGTLSLAGRSEEDAAPPSVSVTVGAHSVSAVVSADGATWKALLPPMPVGGSHAIRASCDAGCDGLPANATAAALADVTFGDVWYCSGQSNMWLPLLHTMGRNASVAAIHAGQYGNIRLMAGDSQQANAFPWQTAAMAAAGGNASAPDYPLFKFSAVCYYYAEALTDALLAAFPGQAAPPLGLVSTAVGGSMIEEWVTNATTDGCRNASRGAHDQTLYDANVVPYLDMTVKGWLWYQGENNCHGTMGNSAQKVGYGCQMPALVALWRKQWSATPGTTDPLAPFGVVTLASGGSEGGSDIGGMRWSQTANYGALPNPAMPNTFLAQAYDLGDPWPTKTCYSWACCWNNYNATRCAAGTASLGGPAACDGYCDALGATGFYMGPIHPRLKKPLGARLAAAAMSVVYGGKDAPTGPTIAGCAVAGASLTLSFEWLLGGDTVVVQGYNRSNFPGQAPPGKAPTYGGPLSSLQVLTNASLFCLQPALRCKLLPGNATRPATCGSPAQEWWCPADGEEASAAARAAHGALVAAAAAAAAEQPSLQGTPPRNPYEQLPAWRTLNITAGAQGNTVVVDLSPLGGTPVVAVRYAWGNTHDSCCDDGRNRATSGITVPCAPAACPILAAKSSLPANPFVAMVQGGKCKCIAPQVCDA